MTDAPAEKDFPDVAIGPSDTKFAIMMGVALVLTGGAYWVVIRILTGGALTDFPLVPLIVCGTGAVVATVWILLNLHARACGQPRLVVDATGISDPSTRFGMGAISWDEIRDVRAMPRKQVIWLLVDDKKAVLERMHPLRRTLIWFDSAFARDIVKLKSWRLECDHDYLLALLAHYHRHFGNPRP